MKIAKSKSKTISKSSNVSNESDESDNGLYAATRLYRRNATVKAIPVKEIKNFNSTIRKFPYDAQILISESEEGKTYEVASVLGVSVDKEKLEKNNGKRFTKVNKRRSDVDYNLKEQEKKNQKALIEQEKKKQKALKEQEIKNQKPLKRTVNLKTKGKKLSLKRSSLSTTTFSTEKIDVLNQNTLTFEPESFGETLLNEVEKKNEEIERLKKEIELLKQTNTSYLPSSSASTTSLANLTGIKNIHESAASFNYSYIGKITTPSGSVKTTSEKSFTNLISPLISLTPTPSGSVKATNTTSFSNNKITTPSGSVKTTSKKSFNNLISPLISLTPTPSGSVKATHTTSFSNNKITTPSGSVKTTSKKSFNNLISPLISLTPTSSGSVKATNTTSSSNIILPITNKITTPYGSDIVTKTPSFIKIITPMMDETPTLSGFAKDRNNQYVSPIRNNMINTPSGSVKVTVKKSAKRTINYTSDSSIENEKESTNTNGKKFNKIEGSKKAQSDVYSGNDDSNSDDEKAEKKSPKGKYIKKIKVIKYDTDDYNRSDSEKKDKLTKWTRECINEETGGVKQEEMFHLHYGVSIPNKSWKKANKTKSSQCFVREVAGGIWSKEALVRKALLVNMTKNPESREELTPKKREALKKVYTQFLLQKRMIQKEEQLTKRQQIKRERRIKKFRRELGIYISELRGGAKPKPRV